jgi:uncharacterized membrane protein YphA (DoxX/SURF4 family)
MTARRVAVLALRIIIGAVFLYAAYTKLRDPWTLFAISIDAYGVLPEWGVLFVARTLPWFELALGLALIAGIWLRYASIAGAALLGSFFVLMLTGYLRGLQIDCGCFGPGEALGPKTLLRDGSLVAIAVALALLAARPQSTIQQAGMRQ